VAEGTGVALRPLAGDGAWRTLSLEELDLSVAIVAAVRHVWESGRTDAARAYRQRKA
jgi:hypothetical protein